MEQSDQRAKESKDLKECGDLIQEIEAAAAGLRGRLRAGVALDAITWFRVGGPAQALFSPADEADLARFLKALPSEVPVTVIGLGSNLLVRDGGIPGVVIRLGRGFAGIEPQGGGRIRAGAAVPDQRLAAAAAEAEIAGLAFYRGIPGGIGGALRMNAGAHGGETAEVLCEVRVLDREGRAHVLRVEELGYGYRHCSAPPDFIFTEALFEGVPGERTRILEEMAAVTTYRETHQPIRERTGGSTFKNPDGESAWRLIDRAGCRGLVVGGAKVSEHHCNFLINTGSATAEDLERLGETVRARVAAREGVELEWEIRRLGVPLPGRPMGPALALAMDGEPP